ncbi:MAG: hypothetical protein AAFU49_22900, partial [Pseudomonadota bacterium]
TESCRCGDYKNRQSIVTDCISLTPDMIAMISKLQLGRIQKRVQANHGVPFTYTDAVVQTIVDRCQELESGGRMIDSILTNTMLPAISNEFLKRLMDGEEVRQVAVDVEGSEFTYSFD